MAVRLDEYALNDGLDLQGRTLGVNGLTLADNEKITLGTGGDAEIYYDGVNLIIDPDAAGAGDVKIDGDLHIEEYLYHLGDGNTHLRFVGSGDVAITGDGQELARFTEGAGADLIKLTTGAGEMVRCQEAAAASVVVNNDGADVNFVVKSDTTATYPAMINMDAGLNQLTIGSSINLSALFAIDGKEDKIQAKIQGHSTQSVTPDIFVVEQSDGTNLLSVRDDGAVYIGGGAAGVDYQLRFDGEDSDGVIIWREDESYFEFQADLFFNSAERAYWRNTNTHIHSPSDNVLRMAANTELEFWIGAGPKFEITSTLIEAHDVFRCESCRNDGDSGGLAGTFTTTYLGTAVGGKGTATLGACGDSNTPGVTTQNGWWKCYIGTTTVYIPYWV